MRCPCHSGFEYSLCCKPYHTYQNVPKTPSLLMKSRYSAYALGQVSYIIETTHSHSKPAAHLLKDWRKEIAHFCAITQFVSLDILENDEEGDVGFVTFRAGMMQHHLDVSFIEKSRFQKELGVWKYHSAEMLKNG